MSILTFILHFGYIAGAFFAGYFVRKITAEKVEKKKLPVQKN